MAARSATGSSAVNAPSGIRTRATVLSKGCKVSVVYKKSHKKKGTVLSINRKAGKKLVYRALVKLTIAKPF